MRKVLIVVDMQNDFVTGSLGSEAAQTIIPVIQSKMKEYQVNGHDVIFTRDTHYDNYLETFEGRNLPVPHCIKGTYGWEVVPELENPECQHIDKETFGYSSWDKFSEYDEFELCGVCTDICVVSNALALRMFYPDKKIIVDANCCAGTSDEAHRAALLIMKSCQIEVVGEQWNWIGSVEEKIDRV